eukprot:3252710-Pleurochrysis_carterae.AAC.1
MKLKVSRLRGDSCRQDTRAEGGFATPYMGGSEVTLAGRGWIWVAGAAVECPSRSISGRQRALHMHMHARQDGEKKATCERIKRIREREGAWSRSRKGTGREKQVEEDDRKKRKRVGCEGEVRGEE